MTPKLVFVAAVARNGVIGAEERTPWRLKSDLQRFRELTWGKPLLMGRRTFESIGRPLPGRETVALSRDSDFRPEGAHLARSLEEALGLATRLADSMKSPEIIVAGGAQIYSAFLPLADVIHLTEVELTIAGDALFPTLDPAEWRETARETPRRTAEDEADFHYLRLERK
ncbi:dihydrofolate reductase [Methylosinus sp. H3A]|uniref:dihydrofolate reductase n=1 Tax=Methylosinus sp. H3A TaxID=2785786 RepID=UPI0018C27257|nr:dihydrofolate reductase [Methylosinus sp. H3A]MBG0811880.1 dihydrofolate reductase [Methylosinus sp. H3A]